LGRLTWGCGLDWTGSGQGLVAGCGECGDEPSGSCATQLVSYRLTSSSYSPPFVPVQRLSSPTSYAQSS
jgi:hypothetical protein